MSEKFIRDVAGRYGLDVLKRVTTGTERAGFATFELTGPPARLGDALPVLREQGPPAVNLCAVSNPDHPDRGKPYIEIQSVWFD